MKYLIPLLISFLNACTPNIIDRDFELEEAEYIKKYGDFAANDPLWQNPTPDNMFLTDVDNISVTIHKTPADNDEGIMLQNWQVVVNNKNDVDKCVNIAWKLQGFKMINEYPGYRLIKKRNTVVGFVKLKQTIWDKNGLRIALPPSGYIAEMDVKDTNTSANGINEICDFYESEDNIVEQ